jgi:hypothetical protein
MFSLILGENFTVIESESAKLLFEVDGPPQCGVYHGSEDWASACLIDS